MEKFKWDNDSTAKAVDLWKNRDKTDNPHKVAADIAEEIIGSRDKWRRVVSKLTTQKVYEKPVKSAEKAVKEPTLLKSELSDAFKGDMDFDLGTLVRGNLPDLVRLAEAMGVTVPEPTVKS